uniref:Uncharacterized protein n=1 Tax=Anguilla anguilla TaxID=7936 RepID=A0A0E9Q8K5_ANGAN
MSHGLTGYMIWHAGSAFFICFQKSQNNYIYHKNTIYYLALTKIFLLAWVNGTFTNINMYFCNIVFLALMIIIL